MGKLFIILMGLLLMTASCKKTEVYSDTKTLLYVDDSSFFTEDENNPGTFFPYHDSVYAHIVIDNRYNVTGSVVRKSDADKCF